MCPGPNGAPAPVGPAGAPLLAVLALGLLVPPLPLALPELEAALGGELESAVGV